MSVLSVSAESAVPEDAVSEDEASAAGVTVAPVLLSASGPTRDLLPAMPNGLNECVLKVIVAPSMLGMIVSIAPLSRRCSIEYV